MTVGGRPLVRDVILRDGTPLRLRAPAPADYGDIKAFYDRLSEDSLYTRFHGSVRTEAGPHGRGGRRRRPGGADRVAGGPGGGVWQL